MSATADESTSLPSPNSASVTVPTTVLVKTNQDVGASIDATNSSRFRIRSPLQAELVLDEQEQNLFRIIVETTEAYAQGKLQLPPANNVDNENSAESSSSPPPNRRLVVRVAGGWVRDKLLRLETHDVDLAVDHVSGVQMAHLVQAYLDQSNQQHFRKGRIGVIAANPGQSKHLETAALNLCGLDVDLVNLRAHELYDETSRIPTVRFGTAAEDAARRDFTVNALFYNLQTQLVEDWSGRGMSDLHTGKLVTPLEPVQTFLDDPLRVLRAVRFAIRYSLSLESAMRDACLRPEIHNALLRKVSRERVGKELEGMLSGKHARPVPALMLLSDLQLADLVFLLPSSTMENVTTIVTAVQGNILGSPYARQSLSTTSGDFGREAENGKEHLLRSIEKRGWEEARSLIQLVPSVLDTISIPPQCPSTFDNRLLPLAVFLLPFRTLQYEEKNKWHNMVEFILRESIKFKNKDIAAGNTLMGQVDGMVELLVTQQQQSHEETTTASRLQIGLLLRACKDLWPTCLVMAAVLLLRQQETSMETSDHKTDWIQVTNSLLMKIANFSLDQCWKWRPVFDGKAMIKTLRLPKGPIVGTYMDEQIRWMLQHPQGSKEDCEAHLKAFQAQQQNTN